MADLDLIPYRADLRPDFERLNLLWLEGNSLLEESDLPYLRDPEQHILADGGQIFFALQGASAVGTAAAIRMTPTTFELAKLSVDPTVQGLGAGRRLCQAVLAFAREAGATEVVLTSNKVLTSAIRLYESLGFRHAPLPADVRYETADVFMRLTL
jgi:putative acetyltransferase